jgi:hypothetical protein
MKWILAHTDLLVTRALSLEVDAGRSGMDRRGRSSGGGMVRLLIALTISGAVSLGAYEAGVLACLLSGIRPLCASEDPVIRIDAIGGASAGSMAVCWLRVHYRRVRSHPCDAAGLGRPRLDSAHAIP